MIYKFTIQLRPKSKKNSRPIFVNRKTGKRFPGKSPSLKAYEDSCFMILTAQKNNQKIWKPLTNKLRIKYVFEFKGNCALDGDNCQLGIADSLQTAGVILNDKQIKEWSGVIVENTGNLDQTLIELETLPSITPP